MIGLLGTDPYWRQVARQEGIDLAFGSAGNPQVRVLVVDRKPDSAESRAIRDLLGLGGGVLTDAGFGGSILGGLRCRPTRIRHVVPDRTPLFDRVGVVDLGARGWQIPGARHGRLNDRGGAILAAEHLGGRVVVLPFRVGEVLADARPAVRVFESDAPRPAFERVSRVNRGEVRRLVAGCWRWLLAEQDLPYVHRSYVPPGSRSCFGFRVDSDFGLDSEILRTVELAQQAGLEMSWFINAKAQERELPGLLRAGLRSQDVQLHCYEHRVYSDLERNRANLDRGRAVLAQHGINAVGVAAPYGDWNLAWQRSVEQAGFTYGSDFGIGYDDLPFRPVDNGRESGALQVPCHPISPGRLRSCGADSQQVSDYFAERMELCAWRREPALFYGHPGPIVGMTGVVSKMISDGQQHTGRPITYTAYARWWQEREMTRLDTRITAGQIEIADADAGDGQALAVELPGRRAQLLPRPGRHQLEELDWQPEAPVFVRTAGLLAQRRRTWLARFRQKLRDRHRQT